MTESSRHVVYGWQRQARVPPARFVRSQRVYLWDEKDRRYLDFSAGQMNVNVGYGHAVVLEAMRRQMADLTYIAPLFDSLARTTLAELTVQRLPNNLQCVFFTNSGSESTEAALKIARAVTGRTKIYSAWRSYHGSTAAASAVSGDPRRLFAEPPMWGAQKFHSATCYRCAFGFSGPPSCRFACLESLRNSILLDGPETVAAILLEPIVGTSGVFVPPIEFMQDVRRLCDEHGILLIFDETMSGWGRTGRWFACEHFGVNPDILTTAKGITSGYVPLGAVAMTTKIRDFFNDRPFVAGLTNEGHTLACAAGVANVQVYEEEGLIERSRILGEHLSERLEGIKERHPSVGDVRGKGLFACIELTSNRAEKRPLAGYRDQRGNVVNKLVQRLFDRGLLVFAKWDYVFIAPPLVIEKHELDAGLDSIDEALAITDELVC